MVFLITILLIGLANLFAPWFSTTSANAGQVNIDVVKQACLKQCNEMQDYEFCSVEKDVSFMSEGEIVNEKMTCDDVRNRFGLKCYLECD
jgi:hypothetical protein